MTKKIIAFQGTIGANSNLACVKFYPEFVAEALPNFFDVFKAVESGEVEKGMIPLENSYAGRVSEIHNLLQSSNVSIVAEHFFPVTHNLAAIDKTRLEEVREVFSHPQALMQCQNNLRQLKVKIHEFSNTAEAAKFVAQNGDKSKAAICSKMAAEINGLKIIKENFQDLQNNVTTFVTIAKNPIDPNPQLAPVITTLLFTVPNVAGSLYRALGSFANNGVNMLKLESYIPGGFSKEAKFFITIEGHPNQENLVAALAELKSFCEVKMLGAYYADKSRLENQ
jgi:prephenate dehydratase